MLHPRSRTVNLQQSIRELTIVCVVGLLQGQLDGLTQQMRPTLLRLAEMAVDRRVVADQDTGKRVRIEQRLQRLGILVHAEQQ